MVAVKIVKIVFTLIFIDLSGPRRSVVEVKPEIEPMPRNPYDTRL